MAWSASKIFTSLVTDALNSTATMNVDANTLKAALFDNSITPNQTVTSSNTAYGAGVWASGGVFDVSGWPAVGVNLASVTSTFSSNVYTLDAADTASANSSTTISGAYGMLLYNDTLTTPVADQGILYLYFGGAQSVTSGTFTVVYNSSGLMQLTL